MSKYRMKAEVRVVRYVDVDVDADEWRDVVDAALAAIVDELAEIGVKWEAIGHPYPVSADEGRECDLHIWSKSQFVVCTVCAEPYPSK